MVLIQLLLPVAAPRGEGATDLTAAFHQTRSELLEAFGGVTAYARAPAQGVWTDDAGRREQDEVIMVEVVTPTFDRRWWRTYAATLATRFNQEIIHVRALPIELLDDAAAGQ